MPDLSTAGAPNVPEWKLVADKSVTGQGGITVSVSGFARYRIVRDTTIEFGMSKLRWNGVSTGYSSVDQNGNTTLSLSEVKAEAPNISPTIDIVEGDASTYYKMNPHNVVSSQTVAGKGNDVTPPITSIRLFEGSSFSRDANVKIYGLNL